MDKLEYIKVRDRILTAYEVAIDKAWKEHDQACATAKADLTLVITNAGIRRDHTLVKAKAKLLEATAIDKPST